MSIFIIVLAVWYIIGVLSFELLYRLRDVDTSNMTPLKYFIFYTVAPTGYLIWILGLFIPYFRKFGDEG